MKRQSVLCCIAEKGGRNMMQQQQEGQGTENLANEAMGRSTFHFVRQRKANRYD